MIFIKWATDAKEKVFSHIILNISTLSHKFTKWPGFLWSLKPRMRPLSSLILLLLEVMSCPKKRWSQGKKEGREQYASQYLPISSLLNSFRKWENHTLTTVMVYNGKTPQCFHVFSQHHPIEFSQVALWGGAEICSCGSVALLCHLMSCVSWDCCFCRGRKSKYPCSWSHLGENAAFQA